MYLERNELQTLPRCEDSLMHFPEISCDAPKPTAFSIMNIHSLNLHGTVSMNCSEGYVMEGSDVTMTCQANGTWSPALPSCLSE